MMGWRSMVAGAVLAVGITIPQAARAEFLEDAGWGTLTVLSNVLYMPVKVIYATTGGITGGFAYGLTGGDMTTASDVWVPAMGGTYVLTPSMVKGDDPIAFAGMPDDPGATHESAPADARSTESTLSEQAIGGS
jgi:hypothetical protein